MPLEELYDLNLPIGELGFLRVGISQGELQRSIETLRSELVQKTAVVAAMTLVVLLLAFAIIWRLWKRGQLLQGTGSRGPSAWPTSVPWHPAWHTRFATP